MTTAASGLRELHKLHVEYSEVSEQIENGPRQIRAHENLKEKKQTEVDAQLGAVLILRKAADERGLQFKSNEAKIIELTVKRNAATSNKEFDVLKGQIEADEMANSVLEDEILDLFERLDAAVEEVSGFEEQLAAADREHQRITAEVNAAEPGLQEECQRLETAIAESETQLPPDLGDSYRRLVSAHGPGAMAEVEDSACSACFVGLSPQCRVELNIGQIVACNNCGRLLYSSNDD